MHALAVGTRGQHLTVAIAELIVHVAETLDLGRTDEGEILWIEEHEQPLALVCVVVDWRKRLLDAVDRNRGLKVELRKLVANGKHAKLLWKVDGGIAGRTELGPPIDRSN